MDSSVVAYESASLDARIRYANTIAAAGQMIPNGLFDPATGKPSPPKVLLVMETGSMLGLHPMAALQSINVVEGRATLAAQLMAALIRQAGHRLEIIKNGSVPGGDYSVTVVGTRADTGDVYESTWDIPRAMRAQLVDSYEPNARGVYEVRALSERGKPKPWQTYTESMPKWRAISEVALEGFSDVTLGLRSYEEMTDGGIPISDPDPEPTEPWLLLISGADSADALDAIGARLAEKGEGTDKIRAAYRARSAILASEAVTLDADVVPDDSSGEAASPDSSASPEGPSEDDYEAQASAEFDEAVARGEIPPSHADHGQGGAS